jgi:apolipoprotein N-acyltransferase
MAGGFVYFAGTVYWVTEVMRLHGGLPLPVGVAIAGLLAAYLALYCGIFAVVLSMAVRRFGSNGIWFAPAIWVATEWLRATVGGGFPWVLLGTSQATVLPVIQASSIVGVYGISALLALVSTAAVAFTLERSRTSRYAVAGVALLVVLVTAWGTWRLSGNTLLAAGEPLRVGLVQGSVAQEQKWDPRYSGDIMTRYLGLSRQVVEAGADLVLWPEAATPFYLNANAALARPIRELAATSMTPFIIGTDEYTPESAGEPEHFYNAAVLIGTDGRSHPATYRKMHLVPFGEYVPLKSLLFFVDTLVEKVSDFSPGTDAVVFDVDGRRVSVAICYESVYPSLSRQFVQNGSTLLATITNDAWFGRSSAAYQHFEQGAVRAVEEGRFVVRAANTGISGAVDPYGRVIAATPLFEPAALTVDVRLLTSRTIYSRVGDVVVWLSLAVFVLIVGQAIAARRLQRTLYTPVR